MVLQYANTAVT